MKLIASDHVSTLITLPHSDDDLYLEVIKAECDNDFMTDDHLFIISKIVHIDSDGQKLIGRVPTSDHSIIPIHIFSLAVICFFVGVYPDDVLSATTESKQEQQLIESEAKHLIQKGVTTCTLMA